MTQQWGVNKARILETFGISRYHDNSLAIMAIGKYQHSTLPCPKCLRRAFHVVRVGNQQFERRCLDCGYVEAVAGIPGGEPKREMTTHADTDRFMGLNELPPEKFPESKWYDVAKDLVSDTRRMSPVGKRW